jgi:hypothetical protein
MKIQTSQTSIDRFIREVIKYLDGSLCDPIGEKMNTRMACLGVVGDSNHLNETEIRYLIDEIFTFVRELTKHDGVIFRMEQRI